MNTLYALLGGFVLDLLLGDPQGFPHPVRLIGWLISRLEKFLRKVFPKSRRGELLAGGVLVIMVLAICAGAVCGILWLLGRVSPWLRLAAETIFCYQALAMKSLKVESTKVYTKLVEGDLPGARHAVSMIVGRDTEELSEEDIIKAAVETVAENASDGVIAPLIFLAIGGAPLGFSYKAVNTMDSMVGYQNEMYVFFGRAAAKLDDVFNFIPARLSALALLLASGLLGLDFKNAWRVFKRDRLKHASPNSAQTEAVCAGALQVQLAGDAFYFGKLKKKPTIGDAIRPIKKEDIVLANRLMYLATIISLIIAVMVRLGFVILFAS